MSEYDDLASEFGSASKKPADKPASDTTHVNDYDALASEFGSSKKAAEVKKLIKVYITSPKPPISGVTPEQSAEINAEPSKPAGPNPASLLPRTDIGAKAYEADEAGKQMLNSAVTDFQTGHPYTAIAKGVGGLAARIFSPVTGITEGGIGTPITDITGNPEIGNRAAFVASTALPVAPIGGAAVKALPANKAFQTLVEHIGEENLPRVVAEMKANPRLGPADLSPRVLQDTQNLFTTEGPHVNYLSKASADRMTSAPTAIEGAYDASTGLPVNAVQKLKDLAAASKAVGQKEINPAIKGAGAVNITPVVEHIDNVLKPGVMKNISGESTLPFNEIKQVLSNVKGMIANKGEQLTDAQSLHNFQSALRREAEARLKSADGGQRQLGNALMQVRNKIVDAIDEASPKNAATGKGTYRPALSNFRDEQNISEAFHDGYNGIFSNSKKMENRPEFTKQWLDGLSPHEVEAAKEGARLAIDTEIGVARNPALAGQNVVKSEFNREKLKLLFGEKEANTLLKKLEDERAIANTHNKVVEGSQTQMRAASKAAFSRPTPTEVGRSIVPTAVVEGANMLASGYPGIGTGLMIGAKGAGVAKDIVRNKLFDMHNTQFAKYALPVEGPSRDALIARMEAAIPKPKQSLLSRGTNALSRFVAP